MIETIRPPKLPKPLPPGVLTRIEDKGEYTAFGVITGNFVAQTAHNVILEQLHFRRGIFTQTHLIMLHLLDSRFDVCDFSGALWENPRLRRVEFFGCRFSGMQVLDAQFEDVLFKDCILEGIVFNKCASKTLHFEKCNLRESYIEESDITGAIFRQCDLSRASFRDSNLENVDLRRSRLDGMKVNPKDIHGAIIDRTQAIQVVSLIGIKVIEDDINSSEF